MSQFGTNCCIFDNCVIFTQKPVFFSTLKDRSQRVQGKNKGGKGRKVKVIQEDRK